MAQPPPYALEVSPDSTLQFTITAAPTDANEEGSPSRCVMTLTHRGRTDQQLVFKVKTTNPRRYVVRPNQGIVASGASETVSIVLVDKDKQVLWDTFSRRGQAALDRSKERFLVQSCAVPDDFAAQFKNQPRVEGHQYRAELVEALKGRWNAVAAEGDPVHNRKLHVRHVAAAAVGTDGAATTTPLSPEKQNRNDQRLAPPQVEEDEDHSGGMSVYETDDEYSSGSSGGNARATLGNIGTQSPREKEPAAHFPRRRRQSIQELRDSSKSWFTQTKRFQQAIDSSFDMIDADKSGNVTLEELYAGLLLIHLKLAVYAGAPARQPASLAYVTEITHLLDTDDSGAFSKEEFAAVGRILYSQVLTRIVIQWGLALMIVPVISHYIIKYTGECMIVGCVLLQLIL